MKPKDSKGLLKNKTMTFNSIISFESEAQINCRTCNELNLIRIWIKNACNSDAMSIVRYCGSW